MGPDLMKLDLMKSDQIGACEISQVRLFKADQDGLDLVSSG
jgi:hypothetical protein